MSVGKDMYFTRKSKIMDFECGPSKLRGGQRKKKSILQLGERTLKLEEVKVDI